MLWTHELAARFLVERDKEPIRRANGPQGKKSPITGEVIDNDNGSLPSIGGVCLRHDDPFGVASAGRPRGGQKTPVSKQDTSEYTKNYMRVKSNPEKFSDRNLGLSHKLLRLNA